MALLHEPSELPDNGWMAVPDGSRFGRIGLETVEHSSPLIWPPAVVAPGKVDFVMALPEGELFGLRHDRFTDWSGRDFPAPRGPCWESGSSVEKGESASLRIGMPGVGEGAPNRVRSRMQANKDLRPGAQE